MNVENTHGKFANSVTHHKYFLRSVKAEMDVEEEERYYTLNCEDCSKAFEVKGGERHWKTLCGSCWFKKNVQTSGEETHGYFLRKKEEFVTLKCVDCKKPFEVPESESTWKTHCISCWLKINGETTHCKSCDTPIQVYESSGKDLCYSCYLKKAGAKRKCVQCGGAYYVDSKSSEDKDSCYDCFLKSHGVKRKCVDCKAEMFVLKENLAWKKKCATCYYKA